MKWHRIVHLHFCIYWNSTLENTMVKYSEEKIGNDRGNELGLNEDEK